MPDPTPRPTPDADLEPRRPDEPLWMQPSFPPLLRFFSWVLSSDVTMNNAARVARWALVSVVVVMLVFALIVALVPGAGEAAGYILTSCGAAGTGAGAVLWRRRPRNGRRRRS